MFIPFDELKESSRIWIFQANRKLNQQEKNTISEVLKNFTSQWKAHNNPLNSSFTIDNDLHLVIGVDLSVNEATGCSIDALTHQIQQLGRMLDIDFFDRKAIAYEDAEAVEVVHFANLKKAVDEGDIQEQTLIYHNLIQSKGEMQDNWRVPAKESWIKRYLGKGTLTT